MSKLLKIAKKIINNKGATLMELLIVIAVMGIALIPASQALFTGLETFVNENENMERVYDAHTTLEIITDKIRFNGTQSGRVIDIKTTAIDGSDRNTLIINTESIYYHPEKMQIISKIGSKETILLENVQSMTFDNIERIGEDTNTTLSQFDIAIVVNKMDVGDQIFNTTIYLRNR